MRDKKDGKTYIFRCGCHIKLPIEEYEWCKLWGDVEFCMHHCPDKTIIGDIYSCKYWKSDIDSQKFM